MGTTVSVNTYTHSVTYVTDQMLRSLRSIISWTGLDTKKFVNDWALYERGVNAWLTSRDLHTVVLEVISPQNLLVTRCDFEINYTYGSGEGTMWVDTDAIKFAIKKFGAIPAECSYTLTLVTNTSRPDVEGWYHSSLRSTTGFIKQSLGTTIGTHLIGAQASYYRKS